MTETPNTLCQELNWKTTKRRTHRYVVEIVIQGAWIYYFSSDRIEMAKSIAQNLKRPARILEGSKVIHRYPEAE